MEAFICTAATEASATAPVIAHAQLAGVRGVRLIVGMGVRPTAGARALSDRSAIAIVDASRITVHLPIARVMYLMRARGNEKGRVERAIRHVRDSFFAARTCTDLANLNAQAALWCNDQAADRICPANRELRVRQAFEHEQLQLLPLPDKPFNTDDVVIWLAGK